MASILTFAFFFETLLLPTPLASGLKVIGAGLRHTGCDELSKALDILGFNTYHSGKDLPSSHPEWTEIMQAMNKRGGKEKSDPSSLYAFVNSRVDEGYDAIVSSPAAFYTLELLKRWPKAKVIITTHSNKREWFAQMQTGTQKALHRDMVKAEYHRLSGCQLPPADADFENCTDGYDMHNNKIKKKVPKSQYFEFKLEMGWGPLCEFLGVPVPNVAFPWSKENKTTSKIIIFASVFGVLMVVLLVAAITMSASPGDVKKDDRGSDSSKAGSNSKKKS